ncbi:T-box protein [Rhynchospora pubera]|uniref:T-box protein n=1 Tax=Rhynchospora pubera TaxID=906938 RepID=A0AAV8HIG8_9POAL|nr:T-box protein [Rhynchospora pubera]
MKPVGVGSSSLSLRLAFAVSFTLSFSLSTSSLSEPKPKPKPITIPFSSHSHSSRSLSPAQSFAADLLSLLATPSNRTPPIPSNEAQQLSSCLKFLVPFSPDKDVYSYSWRRAILEEFRGDKEERENEMVWWPPEPVMELARLAVDSGGDPAAIQRALDPTVLPVPDVDRINEDQCELTRTPYGRRFANEVINSYLAFLFELIVTRGPSIGLNLSLSRYDLFHGHIFVATETGRLGILFHAREYPAFDKEDFPYYLGHCQSGSNVSYDESMNLRNILWLAPLPSNATKAWLAPGVLVVLDAHPDGIIYQRLVPDYVDIVRTVYEDDFGLLVADVNYLNIDSVASAKRIFIC